MATRITKCPACKKCCTWHPLGGIQCVRCGYGCPRLNLAVQAEIPKGKIKIDRPIPPTPTEEQNSPLNPNKQHIETFDLDVQEYFVEPGKQINLF